MKDLFQRGDIANKSYQVFAYADDVAIVARNMRCITNCKTFEGLERETREVGLAINKGKTKYLRVSRKDLQIKTQNIRIGKYNFEAVKNFVYLDTYFNERMQEIARKF